MNRLHHILILACATSLSAGGQTLRLGGRTLRPAGIVVGGASITASPGNVNFALASASSSAGSTPITVTTQIAAIGVLSNMQIVAYFTGSNALTSTAGDTIPSSAVYARCSTCASTAWSSFTQTSSLGGPNSFVLENGLDVLTVVGGTRNDTLSLKIDLSGLPQQPAGTYTGTLVLAAQMF